MRRQQIFSLRRETKIVEHRCGMEVGKSELRAGKPRTFLHSVLEHFQARACPRKRLCDPRFIARSALARIYDALDIDVPNEGAICVGIQDAGRLVIRARAWAVAGCRGGPLNASSM